MAHTPVRKVRMGELWDDVAAQAAVDATPDGGKVTPSALARAAFEDYLEHRRHGEHPSWFFLLPYRLPGKTSSSAPAAEQNNTKE